MPVSSADTATRFTHALARLPARSIVDGLRAVDVGAPDHGIVLAEHEAYVEALEMAGLVVDVLPALEDFPDSVFVEDTALVFPEGAIALRPGAASRFGETALIRPELERRFPRVIDLPGPGTADGGDVMTLADRVLIGLSARTDRTGAEALVAALATLGRRGVIVTTPPGVLHFKSDSSPLGDRTVLSTHRLAASGVFDGLEVVLVPEGEEAAANALRINDLVLVPAGFPGTAAAVAAKGLRVMPLETTEIAKVDAGLSCMSLRWRRA